MGRTAYLRAGPGLRLTSGSCSEQWPDDPPSSAGRRRRSRSSSLRRRGAGGRPLAQRLARALAVPHVAPGPHGRGRVRPRRPARRSSPSTTRSRSRPPRTRSSPSPTPRSSGSGRPSGSRRTCWAVASRTATSGRETSSSGHGDPTLSSADLAAARGAGAGRRDHARDAAPSSATRRSSTRGAPRPAGSPCFYVNESPPLSALAVDRGRYHGRTSTEPGARGGAALPRRARARGRRRSAGVGIGTARRPTVPLARSTPRRSRDRPLHGPRQRQLHRRAPPEAARGHRRAGGTSRRGAPLRAALLAEAGVPLAGVRLVDGSGLSLARPPDRAARSSASSRAAWADPDVRPAFLARPARSRGRTGRSRTGCASRPARGRVIAKTGTTSGASALSGLRQAPLRLRGRSRTATRSSFWARRAQDRFATRS